MGAMPQLTDRSALSRHRARATAPFLREAVAAEVEDRLLEVNRRFTAPAVVTPFPQVWAGRLPGAKTVPDTEVLDLEPGAHDLVIHDLCLHWADDPVGQLAQAARALQPDGFLLATLFGGTTLAELRGALAEAEVEATGGLSPRVAPMGEIRDLGNLLGRVGLALPVADSAPFDVSYADALALMRDLRAMGESNALEGRLRRFSRRDVILGAMARYPLTDGRAVAHFEVVTLTAWAPAPSQPKALRPGSAARSLAEALEAARRENGGCGARWHGRMRI
ncbi:methyltransferase domain-containing protein [Rubellimicrobium roseum]|uniref:Methyltransferase domain-containing protein n=2 Tax=Rubellimicrobium roseum TaxID=687525 RepID=A0A5C4NHS6_9RHOB|nr:methyltransferase domain-containing protein [Rubellimicrobium roseum]TNC74384.1 methyltransferase domain-containing protein [Rubellimicrobium roseum]